MKWNEDLIKDIRTNSEEVDDCGFLLDDSDSPSALYKILTEEESSELNSYRGPVEVTDCNIKNLEEQFLKIKDKCNSILEIGVSKKYKQSFCNVFFKNKNPETKYVGLDIENRSWVINEGEEIYFLRGNSSDYEDNVSIFKEHFGVDSFDFILIDGWHSINQVLNDWEYTNLLNDGGIVGLHDTSKHPGPYLFVKNLNRDKWEVIENCCPNDWGIGFVIKKELV